MGGDKNSGDTVVVDRPTATVGIAAIRGQQTKITDAGSEGAGVFDKVTKALGITIAGQATVEAPTGGADTVRRQAAALSRRVGSVAGGLEKWMTTELGIQTDTAQTVTATGDGGKTGTVDGSFAGVTASGTANVAVTPAPSPAAAPAGTPSAFAQK